MTRLNDQKHTLQLSTLDARNIAQGLREAALDALALDRYVPAITYFQFAAHLATLVGMPSHAKRDLAHAHDAEAAMRLEAIQAAEDALEEDA